MFNKILRDDTNHHTADQRFSAPTRKFKTDLLTSIFRKEWLEIKSTHDGQTGCLGKSENSTTT